MSEGVKVQRRLQEEGRVSGQEAKSSEIRVAPSPGVQQSSNGILGRAARRRSRIDKEGREHRGRDSPNRSAKGLCLLVAGIDVGAEVHHVAVVDQSEAVVDKPTAFGEDANGYQELFALLARAGARGGEDLPLATASALPPSALVVMEATGHYWQNLLAALPAP
jgi:Transposase